MRSNGSQIAGYEFKLDKAGNIIEQTSQEPFVETLSEEEDVDYTYNSVNRIEKAGNTHFAFDNNGNTLQRGSEQYRWDTAGRLTSAAGTTIEYDPMGNIRQYGTHRYLTDISGIGNVIGEVDASGNITCYYLYGAGLEARINGDGTIHYYVSDFRGSTVAMVNDNAKVTHRYQYDDFGNITKQEETDFNPFRYVGKHGVMYLNDHLYYMRARHYDPTIGRFLSEDPIWSTNLYPYADNNPIMKIDPKGEFGIETATIAETILTTTSELKALEIGVATVGKAKSLSAIRFLSDIEHVKSAAEAETILDAGLGAGTSPSFGATTTASSSMGSTAAASSISLTTAIAGIGGGLIIAVSSAYTGHKLVQKGHKKTGYLIGVLGTAGGAALVGATIGSMIAPGVGTAVGAVAGGVIGGLIGGIYTWKGSKKNKPYNGKLYYDLTK